MGECAGVASKVSLSLLRYMYSLCMLSDADKIHPLFFLFPIFSVALIYHHPITHARARRCTLLHRDVRMRAEGLLLRKRNRTIGTGGRRSLS